tara:strand:+ start:3101 stop:3625 length:525 start_codon:yes stop_codon:yes gene_type:complete
MASLKSNLITNSDSVPAVMNDVGQSGGRVRIQADNFEWVGATLTTAADFARLCRIPSNARIINFTTWNDTLDDGSAIVIDMGVMLHNSDTVITAAATHCIVDGSTAFRTASVAQGIEHVALVSGDITNMGKPIWEVAGYSTDPNVLFDVTMTAQVPAGTDATGNVAFRILYTVD